MAQAYDAVIIGAGHNGLVCGTYLAKAGLKTLVVERRHPNGIVHLHGTGSFRRV